MFRQRKAAAILENSGQTRAVNFVLPIPPRLSYRAASLF
ncbi:hypothetical protein CLOLEP_03765 [[Clostridium] leptum DSM 753]|uniref:Uncharacterized protein n=1 Tax=[Clostridium] leptum DSM 753 TaxID=428125 RepID=A7VYT7_9FIRM|nr:hypothetical protein CLOLEP_03765 [[Clostridium] leptum DSM 753]